jgi:hypothetical protein
VTVEERALGMQGQVQNVATSLGLKWGSDGDTEVGSAGPALTAETARLVEMLDAAESAGLESVSIEAVRAILGLTDGG